MQPKVSVIIPIYNTEKYLSRCMKSVLKQTLKDIEIILVDDESPDHAPEMCDKYAKADSRIKVIHKKNGGLGYARNSGMELATGEYVAFLDSDDYVDIKMYEALYCVAKEKQCDVVLSGYYFVDRDGNISDCKNSMAKTVYENDGVKKVLFGTLGAAPEDWADNILGMSVWRGIYSLNAIKKNEIQFPSEREYICEDAIFHIDFFAQAKRAAIIEEPMYYYCNNPESLSRVFRKDRFEKDKIVYQKEYEMLEKYGILDEGKTYIDRMFLTFARVFLTEAVYQLSVKEAMGWIEQIMNDNLLVKILREYPYQKNPKKQRLFNSILKKQNRFFAFLLLKIAAYRKRHFYQE